MATHNLSSYIVIMAGTNDGITKTSEVILVELLQLKSFEYVLSGCKVVISCPTDTFDRSTFMQKAKQSSDSTD